MDPRRPPEPVPDPSEVALRRLPAALVLPGTAPRGWRWWLIGSMLAVLGLAMLHGPVADRLWPRTRVQTLYVEAGQALAEGRLSADDGSGARELYEAALAIDPDRVAAHQGLARVAQAALEQARQALAEDRFADARSSLALARELSVPRADADAVADALRQREASLAGVDGLFAHARDAHAQGRLEGGVGSALPLYAHVLALQPTHPGALRGREDALAELLAQARQALRAGDLGEAARLVATVRTYDPGHVDLPDTQARLVEEAGPDGEWFSRLLAGERTDDGPEPRAATARDAGGDEPVDAADRARRVAGLLDAAAAAEAAGRHFEPTGQAATDHVAAALRLAPDSPEVRAARARLLPLARDCHASELRANSLRRAAACLDARADLGDDALALSQDRRQLAERWLAVGDERLGAGEIDSARGALAGARRADPDVPGLAGFERRVRAAAAALRLD